MLIYISRDGELWQFIKYICQCCLFYTFRSSELFELLLEMLALDKDDLSDVS